MPLTLAKNFPLEMQGRLAEAIELCEMALEAARLSASPHELYRALFELGWTRYYAGDLAGAIAAHEESARVDPRLAGGTIPNGGGGPGWGLGVAWLEAGEVDRARQLLLELVRRGRRAHDARRTVLRLGEPRARSSSRPETSTPPTPTPGGRRTTRRSSRCSCRPPSRGGRGPPCSSRAASRWRRPCRARVLRGRRLGRSATAGGVLACPRGTGARSGGRAADAVAALRDAERELDACGSVRVRDEMRRELRRLGARAEPRGPAPPGDSGVAALTKRELEIAQLVTDRLTNREIAAALFLSDKTVESHLRNIFHKLGVSSRVEVARAVERERTGSAGTQA